MAYTTVDDPTIYFNSIIYTGDANSSTQRTVGFQPDWSWIKARNQAYDHRLQDSVRGGTKSLDSNTSDAEATFSTGQVFNSTGFTIGDAGLGNESSTNYVSWNWKAGGSASSNSDGSITSSVSVNQTAGFSIVKYTGTDVAGDTVGHGLGAVPKMIILKRLVGSGYDWVVYHKDKTAGLYLNSTGNNNDSSSNNIWFNGTAPTSSVFSIGTDGRIGDATDFIAYCFAEKKGYSKFGSYTGNGSTDGTFVYTGFKPAWIMIKRTNDSANWCMYDNKRSPFNVSDDALVADDSVAEYANNSGMAMDYTSQGFKIRGTNSFFNTSGSTYIYMAFAESPFVTSTGIPTTAR